MSTLSFDLHLTHASLPYVVAVVPPLRPVAGLLWRRRLLSLLRGHLFSRFLTAAALYRARPRDPRTLARLRRPAILGPAPAFSATAAPRYSIASTSSTGSPSPRRSQHPLPRARLTLADAAQFRSCCHGVRLGHRRGSRAAAPPAAPLRRPRPPPQPPVLLLLRLFAVQLGVTVWWPTETPDGAAAAAAEAAALGALQRRSRLLFKALLLRPDAALTSSRRIEWDLGWQQRYTRFCERIVVLSVLVLLLYPFLWVWTVIGTLWFSSARGTCQRKDRNGAS